MNDNDLEKYSSAVTLSDMEIFVFPELMYSLVLANIMSPAIWKWLDQDCFVKLAKKSPYKKLMRLKQYIMDNFDFNLDLETWGLTNQKNQLARFKDHISPEDIAKSNALFGYHGDEYYFDVDIRKHFGLDKYDSNIIPYWKTETVEAMQAFKLKNGYKTGAGECVSLAALYAAAAFIVCRIPLDDIYMILTPLHSQNYIDINDGVITNNRRIVTKTMWFNGTAISNKAQRALRNEQVTIVAHNTGCIHCFYDDATIEPHAFKKFSNILTKYLTADLSTLTIANFLRCNHHYQKYFQFCCDECKSGRKFAKAEVLFQYEHGSTYRIADDTFEKLLEQVSDEDLIPYKLPDRVCCRLLYAFVQYENIDIFTNHGRAAVKKYLTPFLPDPEKFLDDFISFLKVEPRLPDPQKNYMPAETIKLDLDMSRVDIINYLESIRRHNSTADLAFYAFRDMRKCSWPPFIKAAIQRNPVSIELAKSMTIPALYNYLCKMPDDSIYDSSRLAQPDEIANFNSGDGLEKAILLANIILNKDPQQNISIKVDNSSVNLTANKKYSFESQKQLTAEININKGRITQIA